MNEQWSHHYNPALCDEAIDRYTLGCEFTNSILAEDAYRVSPGQYPQWTSIRS